ncbi:hypothetical protein E2P81_ATG08081 [Venturia nashicola]|nr:hypothetical protein E2P81_ATG08081 [Venturia nashicola]
MHGQGGSDIAKEGRGGRGGGGEEGRRGGAERGEQRRQRRAEAAEASRDEQRRAEASGPELGYWLLTELLATDGATGYWLRALSYWLRATGSELLSSSSYADEAPGRLPNQTGTASIAHHQAAAVFADCRRDGRG